ncbi:DUF6193 family natural product biosynthesis protein [Streptomyces sp. ECR2.10]
MSEAPDNATAWRHLLERTPGTRQGDPLVIEAAYAQPQLRALYPFPTHGTLHFLRSTPPWHEPDNLHPARRQSRGRGRTSRNCTASRLTCRGCISQ